MSKEKKDKIAVKINNNKITITGELRPRLSKSGKSTLLLSTSGNIDLPKTYKGRPLKLGINLYSTKPRKNKNINVVME